MKTVICYKCIQEIQTDERQYGLHPRCFQSWFSLPSIEGFKNVEAKSTSSKSNKIGDNNFTKNDSRFHGKFKKYSATLGDIDYILKVKEEKFPELPGTEYLCNQIAQYLKINVPPFYYIMFEEAVETFVSRNFMQDYLGNLNHIYIFFNKDEDFNCENLIKIISEKTGRLFEIERFIELCLFDALIGNNDRHGRNLAFVQTAKGLQLSPFYDNPCYLGIETDDLLAADHNPAGQIFTANSKEPKMKEYVEEFIRLEYKETIISFKNRIKLEEIYKLIEKAFISIKRKTAIKKIIDRRYGELLDVLRNNQ